MKILLTYNIPISLLEKLQKEKIVIIKCTSKYPFKEQQLIKLLRDKDGVLSTLTDKLSVNVLSKSKSIKVISQCSAGLDNVDLEYAKQRNIKVYNTPTVLSNAVAELTVAMILGVLRNLVDAHFYMKKGKFTGWKVDLFLGEILEGKTVGVIGLGNIGMEVAVKLYNLGAKIIYYSRTRKIELEEKFHFRYDDLDNLLANSDIVTVNLPLTKETRDFLNASRLNNIKRGAIFVNTSRGEVLDEKVLIKLLKANHIRAAALDVYRNEPYINKDFLKLKNVLLLPHIGSAVKEIRLRMMEQAVNNLIHYFRDVCSTN